MALQRICTGEKGLPQPGLDTGLAIVHIPPLPDAPGVFSQRQWLSLHRTLGNVMPGSSSAAFIREAGLTHIIIHHWFLKRMG